MDKLMPSSKKNVVIVGAQGKLGGALKERFDRCANVIPFDLEDSGSLHYQEFVVHCLEALSSLGPRSVDIILFAHRAKRKKHDESLLGVGDLNTFKIEIDTIILIIEGLLKMDAFKRGSKILLFGSTNSVRVSQQNLYYHITKKSIEMLVSWFADRLSSHGVSVNGVSMGLLVSSDEVTGTLDRTLESVAARSNIDSRATYFEDVVELVFSILSLKTNQLTGEMITIDGGFSLADHYYFQGAKSEV